MKSRFQSQLEEDSMNARDDVDPQHSSPSPDCRMVDVTTEIVIDSPLAAVADFSGDPSNAPTWYDNIDSVEWLSNPPLRIGARMAFTATFLGRRLSYTYQVVEFLPRERLVMSTSEGPFPMETTYTWSALDSNRTLMKLRNRGSPGGFSKLLAPFLRRAVRRANEGDLRRLKRWMERSS